MTALFESPSGDSGRFPGSRQRKRNPGPKPEYVHIEGDWEDAVKRALKKPPPPKPKNETKEAENKKG